MRAKPVIAALFTAALLASPLACGGESDGDGGDGGAGGTGGDGGSGGDVSQPRITWSFRVIEEGNVGEAIELARAADGSLGVAYFNPRGTTPCQRPDVTGQPVASFDVKFAGDATSWMAETVGQTSVMSLDGLALAYDGNTPAIAYQGGTEADFVCGGTDVMLARREGTWTVGTVATDGIVDPYFPEDEEDCAEYQNICRFAGIQVVGPYPALAYAGGRPLVAFRDILFGFAQDDFSRADLEIAWGGDRTTLDASYGGGVLTRAAVNGAGDPALAYLVPGSAGDSIKRPPGLYVVRWTGSAWERAQVSRLNQLSVGPRRIGFAATGDKLGLAVHDEAENRLVYLESVGGAAWPSPTEVDPRDDTGYRPSLGYDGNGDPGIAYYKCKRFDPTSEGCKPGEDALKFALRRGNRWFNYNVREEDAFTEALDLAFTFDAEGNPVIAFQSATVDPLTGEGIQQVTLARGEIVE